MRTTYLMLIIAAALLTLNACSTTKDKIADAAMQKKQLADGSAVSIGTNLLPTAPWGCQEVGTRQSYSWSMLQAQGSFSFTGPQGMLTNKALNYANQNNLKTNYINLMIPSQFLVKGMTVNPAAKATATYYQCKLINPEKNFGTSKEFSFG